MVRWQHSKMAILVRACHVSGVMWLSALDLINDTIVAFLGWGLVGVCATIDFLTQSSAVTAAAASTGRYNIPTSPTYV